MKFWKLRKTVEFQAVYRENIKKIGNFVIILFKKNQLPNWRVGIVVSKKIGNAVKRNKVKRRIREIVRLNQKYLPVGFDIVIISRRNAYNANFRYLKRDILNIMKDFG